MVINNAIPKFIALLLVSIAVAFIAISADTAVIAKADSMTSADFIAYVRGLHQHSFVHIYVIFFIANGLFLASVEFVAYVIGLCFKRKPAV